MNKSIRQGMTSLAVVLCGGVFALQCIEQPDDFIAPTSDIQLSIPLADITRTLDELFSKDTSAVKPDGAGGYYFEDTQEGDPTKIDSLKIRPEPNGFEVGLGKFEVAGFPATQTGVTAGDLGLTTPFPAPFPGATAPLPTSVGNLDFSGLFDFMAVSTGSLKLVVQNTFPVDITFSGPLQLVNSLDNSPVASFPFTTVPAGQSDSLTSDLAGVFVRSAINISAVNLTFASSGATAITINASDGLTFSFSSSTIVADSATAVVPSQNVAAINDSVIVIDDSISVQNATFSSGSFIARIVNNLGINVGVQMRFDNFKNPATGNVLEINQVLLPRSTNDFPVFMDTTNLVDPVPASLGSQMKFSAAIQTINSAGQKSTVTSNDFVRAEFLPQSEFVINSIEGRIKPTVVSVSSGASGASLGEAADKFSGSFTFDSVRIAIDLGLSGGFPIGYDLILWARNNRTGVQDSLVVPPPVGQTVNLVTPGAGQLARIVLGNSDGLNTFLARFVPNFPDTFVVRGQLVINPNFEVGLIQEPTEVYQKINTYFPLKFGLAGGQLIEAVDLEGSNFPTDFTGDVRESSIRIAATNHLPVNLEFNAVLLGPDTDVPGSPRDTLLKLPVYGESRTILAPPIDAGGNVTGSQESAFRFTLTPADVHQFNKADTMIIRLAVQTSNGGTQSVRYRASDYIRLRMSGNLVYILREKGEGE